VSHMVHDSPPQGCLHEEPTRGSWGEPLGVAGLARGLLAERSELCGSDQYAIRVQGLVPEPPDDPQPLWPPR
jgi:hypothetical protein